jgi:hypothetical protein
MVKKKNIGEMSKKATYKRYPDSLKSLLLAIILWAFLPLRFCVRGIPYGGPLPSYSCYWTTLGWEFILEWYYTGPLELPIIIFNALILLVSIIISFSFLKFYKKVKNKYLILGIFLILYIFLNILMSSAAVSATTDSNLNNNGLIADVNVKETQELKINFVPVDWDISSLIYINSARDNIEFINLTYPLSSGKFSSKISVEHFNFGLNENLTDSDMFPLLKKLYKKTMLGGKDYDRVVGIVPENWFRNNNLGIAKGYSYPGWNGFVRGVLIEPGFRHGAAHEIGHTIADWLGIIRKMGLCDENNDTTWEDQDKWYDYCPNGDSNPNDDQLDDECKEYLKGCPAYTLKRLVPWLNDSQSQNEITLFNFMGNTENQNQRWISKDSYDYLLEMFETNKSYGSSEKTILISGDIYKNGTIILDDFYILNESSFLNDTAPNSNFSIILKNNSSNFYEYKFEPVFILNTINGDLVETNVTSFITVLPYSYNVTRIILQNSTTVLAERNVSLHSPNVSFTTSFQNQTYTEDFTVNWNGSDIDGDNLTYSVLISDDGGQNFTTLALDTEDTNLTIDNSFLENSSNFKLKVLATDGVRTDEDISNFTFSVQPDPYIELVSPEDYTRIADNIIIFRYKTFVLNANITNCSLYINGIYNLTNSSSIIQGEVMNFTKNLSNGDYNWTIKCTDSRGFIGETEIQQLTISLVVPEIENVTAYPNPQEFGKNVTIEATVAYPYNVKLVMLNITLPNGTFYNYYNISNVSYNLWRINNFTNYIAGIYNYTFFVEYSNGSLVEESGTFIMTNKIVNLTECMKLNSANTAYYITKDLHASGTCINITANNITVDGQGNTVYYAESSQGQGIYISGFNNSIIKNLIIRMDNNTLTDNQGVYLKDSFGHRIYNNSLIIKGANNTDVRNHGIELRNTRNSSIDSNTIITVNQKGYGIYIYAASGADSSYNHIENNSIETYRYLGMGIYSWGLNGGDIKDLKIINNRIATYGSSSYGIYLSSSDSSSIVNSDIKESTITTFAFDSYGLRIVGSSNNSITSCNISASRENDTRIDSGSNNTLLNVTYIDESVSGQLIRKWHLNAQVNYTNGAAVNQSNVTCWNVTGNYQFSELTNSNGQINAKELVEYVNNAGNKTYSTPYIINVSKNGYVSNSTAYNLTLEKNIFHRVILNTGIPSLEFKSPTPSSGTSTSSTSIQINVSISSNYLSELRYNWNGTNYTFFDNSLIVHYNFDNRSELGENVTYVADLSKYSNNATVVNGAVWNATRGKYGGAFMFDGINDYIRVNNVTPTNFVNFTACIWFNVVGNNTQTSQFFFGQGDDYNPTYGWHFRLDSDGSQQIRLTITLGNGTTASSDTAYITISRNVWNHACLVQNGTNFTLYNLNNNQIKSIIFNNLSYDPTKFDKLIIGALSNSPDSYYRFNGTFDNVMIWNRSFSANEINQLYMSSLYKYNATQWYLYVNQSKNATTGLNDGTYIYHAYAKDSNGNLGISEIRNITVNTGIPSLEFKSPTPSSGTSTVNTSIQINVSISSNYLSELKYNWNGTNYTFFDNSLVLLYNFDNRSALGENDTGVIDLSRYGNDGIFINKNGSYWNFTGGKYNGAFRFIGMNKTAGKPEYITRNPPLTNTTKNWTISMWVKRNNHSHADDASIFVLFGYTGWFKMSNLGRFTFNVNTYNLTGGNFDIDLNINDACLENTWCHLIGVVESNYTSKAYVNGVYKTNKSLTNYTIKGSTGFNIGAYSNSYSNLNYLSFNGSIDDVMIFNRSLSVAEINQLYMTQLTKYNQTQWYLYINQSKNSTSGLDNGTYTYQAFAKDSFGNSNQTEKRTITIQSGIVNSPINFVPPTPANATSTLNTSIPINVSISKQNFSSLIYNWNGTNYSFYDSSLVLMMNFENYSSLGENSTRVVDVSRYSNNGTAIGGSNISWINYGKYGGAFNYTGKNNYISIPITPSLYFNTSNNYTFYAWVNINENTSAKSIFTMGWYGNNGLSFVIKDGGYLQVLNMYDYSVKRFNSISLRNWNNIICLYSYNNISCYINGVQATLLGDNFNWTSLKNNTNSDRRVGGGVGYYPFNGSIDEIRLWNRSLSTSEIYEQYTSNLFKFNSTQWYLYVNQSKNSTTGLSNGTYTYYASAKDNLGNENMTEIRNIIITGS